MNAVLPNVGSPPPRRYRLPSHTPPGAMCPTPYTVVAKRALAPSSSSAAVAVYSFSTDAGGRIAVARSENSASFAVKSYTYAPSAGPASASWWLRAACSPASPP
jgi:hypothetical protein